MSNKLSELNLEEDFQKALGVADAKRWKLEKPAEMEVWATMSPADHPQELFQARLFWRIYPDEAPSLKYRDPETGRLDIKTAWPCLPGFRPDSLDACVNYCLEGFLLHPEWKNDPKFGWDPKGNVLLKVLRYLQDELDHSFTGRFKQ